MTPTKEELGKLGLIRIKILCVIERVKRQPTERKKSFANQYTEDKQMATST